MTGDLAEKLLAHFVGGSWIAPLSTELFRVGRAEAGQQHHIVLANRADLDRVVLAARGAAQRLASQSVEQRRHSLGGAWPPSDMIRGEHAGARTGIRAIVANADMSAPDLLAEVVAALIHGQACILQSSKYRPLEGIACVDLMQGTDVPAGAVNLIHGEIWHTGLPSGYSDVMIG